MKNQDRDIFTEFCHQHGWKCTPQRAAVYDFLRGNTSHPDVNGIWNAVRRKIPSITRESVFRICCEFSDAGVFRRLDWIFSARFDGNPGPHGHFLCRRCGRIQDFSLPGNLLPALLIPGEDVTDMEVRFSGVCRECRESSSQSTKKQGEKHGTQRL